MTGPAVRTRSLARSLTRQGLLGAIALTLVLGVYIALVASRAVALMQTGEPIGVGLGVGFALLPFLAVWFVVREWRLASQVQRMADELAAAGGLPVDDLPRSPGGRIDRAAARAAFAGPRAEAEANRDDWAAWFRLAFAYDAAGDRRRARAALRQAAALHRAG